MSEYGDLVKAKCDAFADRVVKLNDYLLDQAANKKPEVLKKKADGKLFSRSLFPYIFSLLLVSVINCLGLERALVLIMQRLQML